jgi:signal transduction histidine kinase
MKPFRGRPALTLVLASALIALLPLLAFLQYRWLGQVSQAEHDKMLENLKRETSQFCKDFDAEVSKAYWLFTVDDSGKSAQKAEEFASSYQHWIQSSSHPGLIKSIYAVEFGSNKSISRFDPATGALQPCDWPSGLGDLKGMADRPDGSAERVLDLVSKTPMSYDGQDPIMLLPYRLRIFAQEPYKIQKGASAVATPGVPPRPGDSPLTGAARKITLSLNQADFSGLALIEFDSDYIKQQFFPALTKQYYSGPNGLDYQVTIADSQDPSRVIYQSEPASPGDFHPDASESICFGASLDQITRNDLPGTPPGQPATKAMIVRSASFNQGPDGKEQNRFFGLESGSAVWTVMVRRQGGSLDAFVSRARRKNLAVSFGILLVLGAGMAMLLLSTHRARKLADQQMEFVAGVSHEFRTPLAVICSAGENLADRIVEDSGQVQKYGRLIESEGRRLSGMVEQVLQFAGVQSGKQAFQASALNVDEVVDAALTSCHPLITEAGFVIDKQVAPHLPEVYADPQALSRAIQNLINNAIKYSNSEHWIGIRAALSEDGGRAIDITVEDHGIGIAPAELSKIFNPFYRGRAVLDAQIHGSGLGLALVKHFVEAAGGAVKVKSSPGRGSAFTLSMPVAPAHRPESQLNASAIPRPRETANAASRADDSIAPGASV